MLENTICNIILGIDFLTQQNTKIDLQSEILRIDNREIEILEHIQDYIEHSDRALSNTVLVIRDSELSAVVEHS